MEWEAEPTHNLVDTQHLHRKLFHTTLVLPAGRAYLTNLESMLSLFNNSPFVPHSPPWDTASDLWWWKWQLSHVDLSHPIWEPCLPTEYGAYSKASSRFRVMITIGHRWHAWQLTQGWKFQGRDIQWVEAIGFELLVITLCTISSSGKHITVYEDNHSVIKGWWKQSSANKLTNHIFHHTLKLS